jgi:hypothetical protein
VARVVVSWKPGIDEAWVASPLTGRFVMRWARRITEAIEDTEDTEKRILKSNLNLSGLNEISASVVQMSVTAGPTMLAG